MTVVEGAGRLEHEAFVYADDGEYVATLAPLLAAAEVAVAVVDEARAGTLRAGLGPAAGRVRWLDAGEFYRQPARTLAKVDAVLRELGDADGTVVVGEVRFGDAEREWQEWARYESAVNRVFERHPVRVVCPYDRRALPASVVEGAHRTHPCTLGPAGRAANAAYVRPEELLRELAPRPVPPVGPPDLELRFGPMVRDARHAFADLVRAWGLPQPRVDELTLAVAEVLANAVRHGSGDGLLRVWRHAAGDGVVCVVDDDGPGTDDPLLGLRPPPPGTVGGYGLWLAAQLFERLELGRAPGGGLRVLLRA